MTSAQKAAAAAWWDEPEDPGRDWGKVNAALMALRAVADQRLRIAAAVSAPAGGRIGPGIPEPPAFQPFAHTAGSPFNLNGQPSVGVVERLRADIYGMLGKFVIDEDGFLRTDYRTYTDFRLYGYCRCDIDLSDEPLAVGPAPHQVLYDEGEASDLYAFLLNCRAWLGRLRTVDISPFCKWRRRHSWDNDGLDSMTDGLFPVEAAQSAGRDAVQVGEEDYRWAECYSGLVAANPLPWACAARLRNTAGPNNSDAWSSLRGENLFGDTERDIRYVEFDKLSRDGYGDPVEDGSGNPVWVRHVAQYSASRRARFLNGMPQWYRADASVVESGTSETLPSGRTVRDNSGVKVETYEAVTDNPLSSPGEFRKISESLLPGSPDPDEDIPAGLYATVKTSMRTYDGSPDRSLGSIQGEGHIEERPASSGGDAAPPLGGQVYYTWNAHVLATYDAADAFD